MTTTYGLGQAPQIGDIVSRASYDRQRVIAISPTGELVTVECISGPDDAPEWCTPGHRWEACSDDFDLIERGP